MSARSKTITVSARLENELYQKFHAVSESIVPRCSKSQLLRRAIRWIVRTRKLPPE